MGKYSRIGLSQLTRQEALPEHEVGICTHGENLIHMEEGDVRGSYTISDLGDFGFYTRFSLPGGHDGPLSLRVVREETPWVINFIFVGVGASDMALAGEIPKGYLRAPGVQALIYSAGEARWRVLAPHGFRSFSIAISVNWIAEHLGVDAAPPYLRQGLEQGEFPRAMRHDMALTPALARIQREVERNPYKGGMEKIFMQARTLDTLNELFFQLDDRKPSPTEQNAVLDERERIMEAREILFFDPINPPSLTDLSEKVGLSSKRLNAGFKNLYGKTCFVLLQEHRLEIARNAILGGDVSLEEATTLAGYKHVSNFITAYRNLFGVTPARHR